LNTKSVRAGGVDLECVDALRQQVNRPQSFTLGLAVVVEGS
jgi:hypothetical protein